MMSAEYMESGYDVWTQRCRARRVPVYIGVRLRLQTHPQCHIHTSALLKPVLAVLFASCISRGTPRAWHAMLPLSCSSSVIWLIKVPWLNSSFRLQTSGTSVTVGGRGRCRSRLRPRFGCYGRLWAHTLIVPLLLLRALLRMDCVGCWHQRSPARDLAAQPRCFSLANIDTIKLVMSGFAPRETGGEHRGKSQSTKTTCASDLDCSSTVVPALLITAPL